MNHILAGTWGGLLGLSLCVLIEQNVASFLVGFMGLLCAVGFFAVWVMRVRE